MVRGDVVTVVEARGYYAFGMEMAGRSYVYGAKTKESYTGHERDAETGLLYAGARYYDSAIARWLVVDPLAEQYPAYSPYNYVLNNPLSLVDPDGRFAMLPDDYIFDGDGNYTGRIERRDGPHRAVVETRGADGSVTRDYYTLNDQVEDPKSIESGEIDRIDVSFGYYFEGYITRAGVERRSVLTRGAYAFRNSLASESMDFVQYLTPGTLYAVGGNGYNQFDAGNFLWGEL